MSRETLPVGFLLKDEYRIESVLGEGGFGITYKGIDVNLGNAVAIKEYFPFEFARREAGTTVRSASANRDNFFAWGRDRFLDEARTLANLSAERHPAIVRVIRYFAANNTAYMVLDFEEGQDLGDWAQSLGRPPAQEEIDVILPPLLSALELIHRHKYLHRDLAPDNIIIRKDGTPVLIDFGAARLEIGRQSRTLGAIVKPHYSPPEQYANDNSKQGPFTDIYALGATLYKILTGAPPPESPNRQIEDEYVPIARTVRAPYRAEMLAAIDVALAVRPSERPQSIVQWRTLFGTFGRAVRREGEAGGPQSRPAHSSVRPDRQRSSAPTELHSPDGVPRRKDGAAAAGAARRPTPAGRIGDRAAEKAGEVPPATVPSAIDRLADDAPARVLLVLAALAALLFWVLVAFAGALRSEGLVAPAAIVFALIIVAYLARYTWPYVSRPDEDTTVALSTGRRVVFRNGVVLAALWLPFIVTIPISALALGLSVAAARARWSWAYPALTVLGGLHVLLAAWLLIRVGVTRDYMSLGFAIAAAAGGGLSMSAVTTYSRLLRQQAEADA